MYKSATHTIENYIRNSHFIVMLCHGVDKGVTGVKGVTELTLAVMEVTRLIDKLLFVNE